MLSLSTSLEGTFVLLNSRA